MINAAGPLERTRMP